MNNWGWKTKEIENKDSFRNSQTQVNSEMAYGLQFCSEIYPKLKKITVWDLKYA